MKKIAFISMYSLLLLLMQACGTEEAPLEEMCILKSITSDNFTWVYMYEPKSYQLKKTIRYWTGSGYFEPFYQHIYKYNEESLVSRIEAWDPDEGMESYESIFYDEADQVVRIENYGQDSLGVIRLVSRELFSYSPASVTGTVQLPDGTTTWTYLYDLDPSGQPVQRRAYRNGELISTSNYSHDGSPNAYWQFFRKSTFPWQLNNNLASVSRVDEDGSFSSSSSYLYRYNDEGYPISETSTYSSSSGSNLTYIYTYEYERGVALPR
jgi:hypothetical protein